MLHTLKRKLSGETVFKRLSLAPLVVLVVLALAVPMGLMLYLSLHDWTVYLGPWWRAPFVGLGNFVDGLANARFWSAVARTFAFAAVSSTLSELLGLGLALLMYRPFAGRKLFYMTFITPMMIVPVVVAYTFELLLVGQGPLNAILSWFVPGDVVINWLAGATTAFAALVMADVWNWTPLVFLIVMAGLVGMQQEPLQAARLLGASRWQVFRWLQLPALRSVLVLDFVLRFLEALKEFDKVFVLTKGGPVTATETISMYLYDVGWVFFRISQGAALSYIVLGLTGVVLFVFISVLLRERRTLGGTRS